MFLKILVPLSRTPHHNVDWKIIATNRHHVKIQTPVNKKYCITFPLIIPSGASLSGPAGNGRCCRRGMDHPPRLVSKSRQPARRSPPHRMHLVVAKSVTNRQVTPPTQAWTSETTPMRATISNTLIKLELEPCAATPPAKSCKHVGLNSVKSYSVASLPRYNAMQSRRANGARIKICRTLKRNTPSFLLPSKSPRKTC